MQKSWVHNKQTKRFYGGEQEGGLEEHEARKKKKNKDMK